MFRLLTVVYDASRNQAQAHLGSLSPSCVVAQPLHTPFCLPLEPLMFTLPRGLCTYCFPCWVVLHPDLHLAASLSLQCHLPSGLPCLSYSTLATLCHCPVLFSWQRYHYKILLLGCLVIVYLTLTEWKFLESQISYPSPCPCHLAQCHMRRTQCTFVRGIAG